MIDVVSALVKLLNNLDSRSFDELYEICFSDDNRIDKDLFVEFLNNRVQTSSSIKDEDKKDIFKYIDEMKAKAELFDSFIRDYRNSFRSPHFFNNELPKMHWALMTIAMKKCLGDDNATAQITDFDLYVALYNNNKNNRDEKLVISTIEQKKTHSDCVYYFNNADAAKYTRETMMGLDLYLHKIRTNSRYRTRKKNLRRVAKTTKRMMLLRKLSINGEQDENLIRGRHNVPMQMRARLAKLFLSNK